MTLKGSKVNLSGFARKTFVGQTVSVYYKASAKKPVSTALVQPGSRAAGSTARQRILCDFKSTLR